MPAATSCDSAILVRRLLAQLLLVDEAPETFRRQRGQQAVGVAEMVRRRSVADPRPLGDAAQGEALDAALGQLGLAGFQQHGAQVAVMVATAAGRSTRL